MGGMSQSDGLTYNPADRAAVFSGRVTTDGGGGFASLRSDDWAGFSSLAAARGVRMTVQGDGRQYKLSAKVRAGRAVGRGSAAGRGGGEQGGGSRSCEEGSDQITRGEGSCRMWASGRRLDSACWVREQSAGKRCRLRRQVRTTVCLHQTLCGGLAT